MKTPNCFIPWRRFAYATLGLTAAPWALAQTSEEEQSQFELSPFEVDGSNDQGYYSERTLAGSRISTPIHDLAASISIINREQLEDTAAVDVNDVFMYDLNTEGLNTYTPTFSGARGGMRDYSAGHSHVDGSYNSRATSNRIRGIGVADNSVNYHPSLNVIPFDTYNTGAIEINRGPNSLLFGQGSVAGIVNQNTAFANTDTQKTEVQFRLSQYGGYRAHINHNQPVIKDELAVYFAALYDSKGFERKPSHDITRRVYAAATYQPTERLRLRGNFENFRESLRRPNTLTPVDHVTPWLEAGSPAYNPISRSVTFQTGPNAGQTLGPMVQSQFSPGYNWDYQLGDAVFRTPNVTNGTNPGGRNWGYIPGLDLYNSTRPVILVQDANNYFAIEQRPAGVAASNPNFQDPMPAHGARTAEQHLIADRMRAVSVPWSAPAGVGSWTAPGVTNKDIYDWTKYNTNSANYGENEAQTYNLELDYKITDDWHIQAGYFRQEYDGADHFTVGQLESVRLYIDPNTHLTDGRENPFLGIPFVHDGQPDTFLRGLSNENMRVQTAYQVDFSDHDGLLHWLGRQNFIGIAQRRNFDTSLVRTRAVFVDGHPSMLPSFDLNSSSYNYWANSGRVLRQYYMGDPGGPQGTVTRSAPIFGQPSFGGPTEVPFTRYNWTNGGFETVSTTIGNAISEASTGRTRRTTDSVILAWNAYLFDDRLVPTIGFRHDNISNQSTQGNFGFTGTPESWRSAGYPMKDVLFNNWGTEVVEHGNTYTYGATFDIWRTTQHELTLFYNSSENFNPPASAQVDVYGEFLPRPRGEGEDYGFSVGLWENKFVVRVNWFETLSIADRTGVAGQAMQRLNRIDTDLFFPWAQTIARFELGQRDTYILPGETQLSEIVFEDTPQIAARMEELTGLPYNYYGSLGAPIGATQQTKAEGLEIGVTYNPTSNWTMRAGVSSQETVLSGVAPELDRWLADRLPVWTAAQSPLPAADNQYLHGGTREADLSTFWGGYGYNTQTALDNTFGIVDAEAWYTINVLSAINLYKAQDGVPVPTQRKWRANFITRYNFTEGVLTGSFIGGGVRYESKAAIGYYGRDTNGNGTLDAPDADRPIYGDANYYFDLWLGYTTPIFDDRADLRIQLNVRNLFEDGGLQAVGANFDGSPHTFRIVEPRELYLTTTISF